MKSFTLLRRRRSAGYVVMLLALVMVGAGYAVMAPKPDRAEAAAGAPEADIAAGKALFDTSCASCHGLHGEGTDQAPSLIGAGAASVDFQVGTGRMPLSNPYGSQAQQQRVHFSEEQIHNLAAYVASMGPGPSIPSNADVDYKDADLALGGDLFRANCASCHNFAGQGGALSHGRFAPQLTDASPTHIYEAMQTGPAAMPVFSDDSVTPAQKRAIIKYIKYTQQEPNEGGFGLGRIGPASEGLVAWLVGLGIIVASAMWISARTHGHE